MRQAVKLNKRFKTEFINLARILDESDLQIIPWSHEELDLLSFHQTSKKSSGWINRIHTGLITSIYQEHVAQYCFRSYFFSAVTNILYVRTSRHQFGYVFFKKHCELFVNDQLVGTLNHRGELAGPRKLRLILDVDPNRDGSKIIKILDREVALVNRLGETDLSFSRMLAWQDVKSTEEEILVLAICVLLNIMKAIKNPVLQSYFRT
ncbi:MAG: hypothetical protein KJP00_11175 [Bacteroidia bacterium]|nr:hypothetical protein [Bacteroidia bacterium]